MTRRLRIAHVSDVHFTRGAVWESDAWEAGVAAVNRERPDVVLVTGDLTDWGLRAEWEGILPRLAEFDAPVLPCLGNHDARREGWRIYCAMTGRDRFYVERLDGVDFVVLDSSEPDLDDGEVGRMQRAWLRERLEEASFPVVVLHHHLVPIPNTGREMNIVRDAGGTLHLLDEFQVPLVLGGHRHMPWVWRLNETLIAHAGTFSSNKRQMPSSFNLVTIEAARVRVELHLFPEGRRSVLADVAVGARWGGEARDRVAQVHEAGL